MTDVTGAIYFLEGDFSDNSFGCWLTDFIWAFALLYAAYWLGSRSRFPNSAEAARNDVQRDRVRTCVKLFNVPGYEHTRYMFTWGFIWLGITELLAGWYHLVFTEKRSHKHDPVWTSALVALGFHASFWLMGCISMYQVRDNTWYTTGLYAITASTGVLLVFMAFALNLNFPSAFGWGSLVPAIGVVFMSLYQSLLYGWRNTYRDTMPLVGGCLCMILGICGGALASFYCGKSCPAGCPLAVPNFNHNALFHVLGIFAVPFLAQGMAGVCYELEDPDGMPYFDMGARNLRRTEQQTLINGVARQIQAEKDLKWTTWSPND